MRKADVDPVALRACVERIFPGAEWAIERTAAGASTQVYRLLRGIGTFYLRLAEERAASLAPETRVHELLRARGAQVPEVVHFEPFDERLQRSIMVTTEIRGKPVSNGLADEAAKAVLRAAGRDLAIINDIPVAGFGWIRREHGMGAVLAAEHPTNRQFLLEHIEQDLAFLGGRALSTAETATIRAIVTANDRWPDAERASLAHGDFDLTHIYQHDGRYTGIIDFGEIRGTAPLYDLGHFNLHDGELMPRNALPSLLEGYREITPLPPEYEREIRLSSLLIGIRALARSLQRGPSEYSLHLLRSIRGSVRALAAMS